MYCVGQLLEPVICLAIINVFKFYVLEKNRCHTTFFSDYKKKTNLMIKKTVKHLKNHQEFLILNNKYRFVIDACITKTELFDNFFFFFSRPED